MLVGVDAGAPGEVELRYAEHDADRMAQVLGDVGDFREEDRVLLRRVDRRRLLDAIEGLGRHIAADQIEEPETSTLLLFYYSGHADADALHLGGSRLSFAELTAALEALPVDLRVLVVDACRSGALTRVKGATPAEPFAISAEDRLAASGTAIITSSAAGEDAQESEQLQGGVFTHHLLSGLLGAADSSADGAVTLTEAYRYVYAQTLRSTSLQAVVQHPTYAFDIRGRDDLVLTRPRQVAHRGTLGLSEGGSYLVFEAERGGRLIAEVLLEGPGVLSLLPGRYLVRRRGDDHVREIEVEVEAASTVPVDPAQMAVMPYGMTARRGTASRRRFALGFTAGGGVGGAPLEGLGAAPVGTFGVRVDLSALTLHARGRLAAHEADNDAVSITHRGVGGDLTLLRLFDLGRVAPGLGLRAGLDRVSQRFDTDGRAPPRTAVTGRAGPVVRLEVAPAARWAFGLDLGADANFAPTRGPVSDRATLSTTVVPYALAEIVVYLY
ncbi:MAG: hypothetical protein ACI8PZ_005782 [Myxococcota bacterium]